MNIIPRASRTMLTLLAVVTLAQVPALAGPSAFTERAVQASFGYSFLGNPGLVFGVGVELPLELGLPVDFSIGADFRFRSSWAGSVSAKALIFPALGGNPPIGLAVGTQFSVFDAGGFVGVRFGLGPLVSFDFSPLVVSAGLGVSFGWPGFSFDLGLGLRYYFDPFAIEAAFEVGTIGNLSVTLGLRYLF